MLLQASFFTDQAVRGGLLFAMFLLGLLTATFGNVYAVLVDRRKKRDKLLSSSIERFERFERLEPGVFGHDHCWIEDPWRLRVRIRNSGLQRIVPKDFDGDTMLHVCFDGAIPLTYEAVVASEYGSLSPKIGWDDDGASVAPLTLEPRKPGRPAEHFAVDFVFDGMPAGWYRVRSHSGTVEVQYPEEVAAARARTRRGIARRLVAIGAVGAIIASGVATFLYRPPPKRQNPTIYVVPHRQP